MPNNTRKDIRGAIIGMVMGDGSLYRNRLRNLQESGHDKLDIAHSIKQQRYLAEKRIIVNSLFEYEIPITNKLVTTKGKVYPACKFCTRVHPRLTFIADRCYENGKKRITPWVIENITDQGLAIWWMDDGHLRLRKGFGGELIFGLYGFPKQDVELLQTVIAARYGVEFRLGKNKRMNDKDANYGWYLRRNLSAGSSFLDQLAQYSLGEMNYKFDHSGAFIRGPYRV